MQILAALLNMSALGSLFTEDKYESQRYRSLQDRRHIIANNENCWKFIYLIYKNLQKLPKILCRLCLDFNWEFRFMGVNLIYSVLKSYTMRDLRWTESRLLEIRIYFSVLDSPGTILSWLFSPVLSVRGLTKMRRMPLHQRCLTKGHFQYKAIVLRI